VRVLRIMNRWLVFLAVICSLLVLTGVHGATRVTAVHWGSPIVGSDSSVGDPFAPFEPPFAPPSFIDDSVLQGEDLVQILEVPQYQNALLSAGVLLRTASNKLYFAGKNRAPQVPYSLVINFAAPVLLDTTGILDPNETILKIATSYTDTSYLPAYIFLLTHNNTLPSPNWNVWSMRADSDPNTPIIFQNFSSQPLDLQCLFTVCAIVTAQRQPLLWGQDPIVPGAVNPFAALIGTGSGIPSFSGPVLPSAYNGSSYGVSQLSLGYSHALSLESTNGGSTLDVVVAWGSNFFGQLGTSDPNAHNNNITLAGVTFKQVAAGAFHSIILDNAGNILVFGRHSRGQLTAAFSPSSPFGGMRFVTNSFFFSAGVTFSKVFAYGDTSFGLMSDNTLYAWGSNEYPLAGAATESTPPLNPVPSGMLGNGDTMLLANDIPTQVLLPAGIQNIIDMSPTSGCFGYCGIYLIVNKTNTTTTTPNTPTAAAANPPPPPSSNTNVVISFGSGFYPGNKTAMDAAFLPIGVHPTIVDLPASGNYTQIAWNQRLAAVLDSSTDSVWFLGSPRQAYSTLGIPIVPWNLTSGSHNPSPGLSSTTPSSQMPADFHPLPINSKMHGNYMTSYKLFGLTAYKGVGIEQSTDELSVFGFSFLEGSNCSTSCPTIVDVSTGLSHVVALLSNGSALSWELEGGLMSPYQANNSHLCQGSTAQALAGNLGLVLSDNITHIASGDSVTIFSRRESGNDVLYSCGTSSRPLGNYEVQSPTPFAVNVSLIPSSSPISSVGKIVCGHTIVMVLETNGRIVSWTTSGTAQVLYPALSSAFDGLVVDISAISDVAYFLTDQGSVYALGSDFMIGRLFPFVTPLLSFFNVPPAPLKLDVNIIDGEYYKITKLFQPFSLYLGASPFTSVPLLLIATPASPISSPAISNSPIIVGSTPALQSSQYSLQQSASTTEAHELRSFGQIQGSPSTYAFGLERGFQRATVPSKMFPYAPGRQVTGAENDQFPFDIATSEFYFTEAAGYAVTFDGKVFGWGAIIHEGTVGASIVIPRPVLLASDVGVSLVDNVREAFAVYSTGFVYVNTQRRLRFSMNYEPSTLSMILPSLLPVGQFDVTGISCHMDYCAVMRKQYLNDTTYSVGLVQIWINFIVIMDVDIYRVLFNWGSPTQTDMANYLMRNSTTGLFYWAYSTMFTGQFDSALPVSFPYLDGFNPMPSLDYLIDFTCGARHCLALVKSTPADLFGTVYAWGDNRFGQSSLLNSSLYLQEPIKTLPSQYDGTIKAIAGSGETSFAILYDGTLLYWGADNINVPNISIVNGLAHDLMTKMSTGGVKEVLAPSGGNYERVFSSSASYVFHAAKKRGTNIHTEFSDQQEGEIDIMDKDDDVNRVGRSAKRESMVGIDFGLPEQFRGFAHVSYSGIQCPQPPPVDPSALPAQLTLVCSWVSPTERLWVLVGNVQSSPDAPLVIDNDVLIQGNLTSSGGLVFRASSSGKIPTMNVTGCATLAAAVTADFSSLSNSQLATVSKLGSTKQVVVESGCTITGDPAKLVATQNPAHTCRKVKSTSSTSAATNSGRSQLTVLFKVNSGACNTWWIILVAVIGGIIVVAAIGVVIAYLVSPKLRKTINPYRGANT